MVDTNKIISEIRMNSTLLIIDPFQKEPARNAINVLSMLSNEVQNELNRESIILEFYFPLSGKYSLRSFLNHRPFGEKKYMGVISLGSYANITENLEWVQELGKDIRECIIEKQIPFLGICFSHQLLAHIYGCDVQYVEDRESLPGKKYEEFRNIEICSERLREILPNQSSFISMAKHEQEVKNINKSIFEITCRSVKCEIEGLSHKFYPVFSFQSHLEESHESKDGWVLIKNFIKYFANLENQK